MIQINNVVKHYKSGKTRVEALKGISFELENGGFMAVTGSSGSGKTTLMNILGCLDKPTTGIYILDGENISSSSLNYMGKIRNSKIGFIFQNFNLLNKLNAVENVAMPLVFRGENIKDRTEKAAYALHSVGLGNRLKHRPGELSGGQQQRVAIARAIVTKPSLLLADEPTGNLDKHSGEEILELLTKLNSLGVTIIMITHDCTIAACAKTHVELSDGRIVYGKL